MTQSPRRRYVSVMIHHDGAPESFSYHLPIWAFRTLATLAGLATVGVIVGLAMVGPLTRAAMRVPQLEADVRELQVQNAKIGALASALDSVERSYARVRSMVGGDIVPDPVAAATDLPVAPPVIARPSGIPPRFGSAATPTYWPLDEAGFVTRGVVADTGSEESHGGLDIAVPSGTIVRATAGGTVVAVGADSEYGNFVRLSHASGYESMYGHLSRVLTAKGVTVGPGDVLGLSGSTGHSSAPHLHFEIHHLGRPVDPLTLVKEGH